MKLVISEPDRKTLCCHKLCLKIFKRATLSDYSSRVVVNGGPHQRMAINYKLLQDASFSAFAHISLCLARRNTTLIGSSVYLHVIICSFQ